MGGIRAVIFDLYETLITEYDENWVSAPRTADVLGVPEPVFDRTWDAFRQTRMTRVVEFRDVLRQVCRNAGVPENEPAIDLLHARRLAAKAKPFTTIESRVLEVLVRLKSSGIRLGLISNCSIEEVAAWDSCPLASIIQTATFSYAVGTLKPEPEIYLRTCTRLGVRPEQAAFVGDGGSSELDGAAKVGMQPYCARWYRDQWPHRRSDHSVAAHPQLNRPLDLLTVLHTG